MLVRIAHTTDFSAQSVAAFRHALRLSLANRCRLDLLHVREQGADDAWDSFPHVREALAEWGLMDARATPADIESKLGVRVAKIEIKDRDVVDGISQFFLTHRPDPSSSRRTDARASTGGSTAPSPRTWRAERMFRRC
jgi:hypothetical protein